MKYAPTLVLCATMTSAFAEPESEAFVTFASVPAPLDFETMDPTPNGQGYSFVGAIGNVYFHHRLFTDDGTDFRINTLKFAFDSDGDGVYSGKIDFTDAVAPKVGNPSIYLIKDGVILNPAFIRNQVVDQIVICNHLFLGRSFSGGTKWFLETDHGTLVSEATHGPIDHPEPIEGKGSLRMIRYVGLEALTARAPIGWEVWSSTDLASWSLFDTVDNSTLELYAPVVEPGEPKKFFRLKSPD